MHVHHMLHVFVAMARKTVPEKYFYTADKREGQSMVLQKAEEVAGK